MGSTDPAVAILPIDLGAASTYDQRIFPLAYYETGDNLTKGELLIMATLEEMKAIKQLGSDLNSNADFIFNTRLTLEALAAKKEKLQENRKTVNPFKAFLNYRAAQLFHAASKALYLQTKRTSEKIHREEGHVRVVPTSQVRMVNGPVPPDAKVIAVSVVLPDGWNDDAERAINDATETMATTDPFQDNSAISQLRDDEYAISLLSTENLLSEDVCDLDSADKGNQTSAASSSLQRSRPTSPSININILSNLNGVTYNNQGSRNSGASVTQEFSS